ncbi:hypothetical protein KUCAC02_013875, partial [Chaenocephalus aceratus]
FLSMSGESQGREASCQAEESVSWKQCIICQSDDDKKGVLVQHPKLESYGLVLQAVQERASLNDGDYVQDDGQQLYQVRTENAGKHLKEAVEMSHNTALKTRLNTCISPDEYVPQILNADVTGQKLYEDYVSEQINGDVSLWAPVKKVNNKMFLSGNKKITVKLRDNTMDLKDTKDLFARLMVLARTDSLKSATRDKRRQGKAIQYQVRDDTNIKHIPLSRFLSHDQTKADLTDYLAAKILEYNRGSSKLIITSASGNTRSNKDLLFEENNHKEADTLLIHQAVLASH